jgi:hypothetical protein
MVDEEKGSDWTFVIDTNEYAGNFEREMCAYITGQVGDCEVGEELAEIARTEIAPKLLAELENIVAQVPDEHGCCRPVTIWQNPRWFNDGMGNEWPVTHTNTKRQLAAYVQSEVDYWAPHIKNKRAIIKDLKAGKKVSNWTIAAANREIKEHQKRIADAKKRKTVNHYPAYLSVGIWLHEKPSDPIIALFKERAANFQAAKRANPRGSWDKDFKVTIEGFRLVQHTKSSKTVDI